MRTALIAAFGAETLKSPPRVGMGAEAARKILANIDIEEGLRDPRQLRDPSALGDPVVRARSLEVLQDH